MADDTIKYSDLVTPDDSIKNLIGQLEVLNKNYETMVNAIRAGTEKTVKAITTVHIKEANSFFIYLTPLEINYIINT